LFVIFYAAIGLYIASKAAFTGAASVSCPFGFDYPYLYFRVNVDLGFPNPPSFATPVFVLISVVFYGITGAISGFTAAWAYNLTSRFWPGIAATIEPEKRQPEPAPQIAPLPPADPPQAVSPTC
jgi:hypothetical protein